MSVAFTSRMSFAETVKKLAGLQAEVYLAIADFDGPNHSGPSIEDIARCTSRKECSICARVNELLKAGVIEEAPLKKNATGATAKTYRALRYQSEPIPARPASPQGDLFAASTPRAFSV